MPPLVSLVGITKSYPSGIFSRNEPIFRDISLSISAGETIGIVGISGSGKSTLGRIIAGTEPVDSGRVLFRGSDISEMGREKKNEFRRSVQILFQDPHGGLNPLVKIERSLQAVLRLSGVPDSKRQEKISELFSCLGLHPEILTRYPHQISGGQAQRVSLARILIREPSVIILDEPTSGLDISVQAQILHLLRSLREDKKISYVIISHDTRVISFMADRVFRVDKKYTTGLREELEGKL